MCYSSERGRVGEEDTEQRGGKVEEREKQMEGGKYREERGRKGERRDMVYDAQRGQGLHFSC